MCELFVSNTIWSTAPPAHTYCATNDFPATSDCPVVNKRVSAYGNARRTLLRDVRPAVRGLPMSLPNARHVHLGNVTADSVQHASSGAARDSFCSLRRNAECGRLARWTELPSTQIGIEHFIGPALPMGLFTVALSVTLKLMFLLLRVWFRPFVRWGDHRRKRSGRSWWRRWRRGPPRTEDSRQAEQ